MHPSETTELSLVARAFGPKLREDDLSELLHYLNGKSEHRFTGVYHFEPGWVVSVALYDREHPELRIGADVKMKESYCWLTGIEDGYVIEDAACDARLDGHVAQAEVRSYLAVLLRDRTGAPWGTLCHFDFAPHPVCSDALAQLQDVQPLIEEMFIREKTARWNPDAPSRPRVKRSPESGSPSIL